MVTTASKDGKNYVKQIEGNVLRAYKDVKGVPTIGYGHTSAAGAPKVVMGLTITKKQANDIFNRDAIKYEKRTASMLGGHAQNVFDGGFSFDYNTGGIKRASWVKLFRDGKFAQAESSLNLWTKSGGKRISGLVRRRKEESDIIFRNRYPTIVYGAARIRNPIKSAEIEEAQQILKGKGLYEAAVDGIDGKQTRKAVLAYQKMHPDLTNDGKLGPATLSQLRRDASFIKDTLKSAVINGGGTATVVGSAASFFGMYWVPIVAGIGAVVVVVILYRKRDLLARRWNKLLGREVQ